jgi:hypothetical protein
MALPASIHLYVLCMPACMLVHVGRAHVPEMVPVPVPVPECNLNTTPIVWQPSDYISRVNTPCPCSAQQACRAACCDPLSPSVQRG